MIRPCGGVALDVLIRLGFDASNDRLLVLDRAGLIVEVNRATLADLDLPPEQLRGRRLLDLVSAERCEPVSEVEGLRLVRLLHSPTASTPTHSLPERFWQAANLARIVVYEWDVDRNHVYRSGALYELLGYSPEEVPPTSEWWIQQIHPEDRERCLDYKFHGHAGGISDYRLEYRVRRRDGRFLHFLDHGRIIRDETGRSRRIYGCSIDVSEYRTSDGPGASSNRGNDVHESLEVLAGGVAHTFNNLLTIIMGFAGLAQNDPSNTPLVRSCMLQVEQASRQAAEVCQRILAYTGRGSMVAVPLDLDVVVREKAEGSPILLRPRQTMTLELAGCLPPILGDASQLGIVVLSLLQNAVEALSDLPGHVHVRTSVLPMTRKSLQPLELGASLLPGDYVVLTVSDTGSGMDEATRLRVFEPFFTTRFVGRGLGPAAVYGIVRIHRGALQVESQLGKGASFRVYLPTRDVPAPS